MPIIALQGIKGSTGTTSMSTSLAWAMQQLGESVLVIDFSPDNMLRLYFNMPFEHTRGWARAWIDGTSWQESALRYMPLLDFIPFGTISSASQSTLEHELQQNSDFWHSNLSQIISTNKYRWILLDLPPGNSLFARHGLSLTKNKLFLLNPDVNCHVRLHQQELPKDCHLVVNKYNSASQLQHDLLQLWQNTLPDLLPIIIHHDEALTETLAVKQPLGEYSPESLASEEINTLANWCLLNFTEISL